MSWFKGAVDYVDEWTFMSTPWLLLSIWITYMFFVLKCGPAYMEKRPAYKLTNILGLYNLFQVLLSCYIVYMGVWHMNTQGIVSSHCAIEAKDTQPYMMRGVWIYFVAKITELLDTVFFVLRKKMNQVSFLHVYHHSLMVIATWFALKYNPTDVLIFLGTLNSFVHVIMYGYYGLSAYPSLAKYLWWKKYITSFQLIQFGLITIHAFTSAFVSKCNTSFVLLFTIFFNLGVMIYLFSDFYVKSYVKKDEKSRKTKITLENQPTASSLVDSMYATNVQSLETEKTK
ncbi:elongation of very long chain fatty acids protein 7-like isoform X1 [Leguminivora glycinivorella]|uniref:elongation of very long chain fatty acids protein 7-like isoform X1 n=2 Tax=Leguminivora glycinivorella TaxID=1035111 RepID=UPI00200FE164|nr:elongation of very long chain fatty acids protein 7-like isoform X1 [Leguminivora glycinivorella]XP_047992103.1 elongation of very long chain fatty acids protein 7-like isoform X1 [Leguminivora glycinivorella]